MLSSEGVAVRSLQLKWATRDENVHGKVSTRSGTAGTTSSIRYWSNAAQHWISSAPTRVEQSFIRASTSGTECTEYPHFDNCVGEAPVSEKLYPPPSAWDAYRGGKYVDALG